MTAHSLSLRVSILASLALVVALLAAGLLLAGRVVAAAPHAPSFAHKVYPASTQAARDWAWHRLGAVQWDCLDRLWQRESGWRVAAGTVAGSFGIPQSYPGSKMASAGPDWRTNPMTQVRWGIGYIHGLYGTACRALGHSDSWGYY